MADTPNQELEQMSEEERRMMSDWEAMSGDGAADQPDLDAMPGIDADDMGGGGSTRILHQSEIDSLLGFDDDAGQGETSGVMA
ncbi:MAG: flagellar motor switch protein FliM, partial [Alphaproteobacteria bacterium]|nr:flagellar motor switch protein FliM [Alphaproteobacteria bacterium]